MALRIQIRREIKQALVEEGLNEEKIKNQINDLVEEELKTRQEAEKRQQELE